MSEPGDAARPPASLTSEITSIDSSAASNVDQDVSPGGAIKVQPSSAGSNIEDLSPDGSIIAQSPPSTGSNIEDLSPGGDEILLLPIHSSHRDEASSQEVNADMKGPQQSLADKNEWVGRWIVTVQGNTVEDDTVQDEINARAA